MNNPHTSSPVFDTVLSLLRSALWGESFQASPDTDWNAVNKELKQQAVMHLPVDILCKENPAQKTIYTNYAVRCLMHWFKIMQLQQDTCNQLLNAGIPCVVLKGASVARYYPQPSRRAMGDIDLLVRPEDFDRACQIVSEGAEYKGENFRHKEYKKNGIILEVHHAFGTLRDAAQNALLDQRLISAVGSAEKVTTENYSFFTLPTVENGIALLMHIDVHLENGLGLRQIIDWMMFVDRHLDDGLWFREFAPFLEQLERKTLATTVTRMCQMYLGLRTDITWCSGVDEQLCQDLMEYILLQGNFGTKVQTGFNRTVSVIHASKNKLSFLKILQKRGLINWKATQRYPFLKPFAWLYQLLRYLRLGLRSEKPLSLLRSASKSVDAKTVLMEQLGVSRMSEEG